MDHIIGTGARMLGLSQPIEDGSSLLCHDRSAGSDTDVTTMLKASPMACVTNPPAYKI